MGGEPVARREGGAEVDAGIAEAEPAPAQHQADLGEPEGEGGARREPGAAPGRLAVERAQQGAVLQDTVVVERHGDEDDVVGSLRIERLQHVVEQPQLGLAQPAVARQAALGIHGLRDSRLGGHMDVALEHAAVNGIVGIAPHEVGAHRADELLQWPDAGPFAHRVAQRRAFGGEEGHQDVVHVAAVVHDEDHGGVGRHAGQGAFVGEAQAHAIEEAGHGAGDRIADAEVDVGVEGRHDLARVAMDLGHRRLARDVVGAGVVVGGGHHLRVVDQPVDQHLPLGELERLYLDIEPPVDAIDQPVETPPQEPAAARDQQAVEQRPQREGGDRQEQPERNGDRLAHRSAHHPAHRPAAGASTAGGRGPRRPAGSR